MSEKEKNELTVTFDVDGNEIKLTPSIVQNYLVSGDGRITPQEFKFFTELCKARKLNPFLKHAYCIKFGSQPATLVVGKDVIVERALRHPQYAGKESGIIVLKDEGKIEERNGCFYAPGETVVGGWCKVYRKDRERPEYMSVSVDDVAGRKKDGQFNSIWSGKTATMAEKVAKVRALREAFIDEFQGMYEEVEFDNQPDEPAEEPKVTNPFEANYEVVEEVEEKETTETDGK